VRILIVGGGIGGLTLAIALHRRGQDVMVAEAAPGLAAAGAGIALWPNALRALRSLQLDEPVIAAGERLERGALRDADGTLLVESDHRFLERETGAPIVALHRADLQSILLSALPGHLVQLNKRLTGFDQNTPSVKARFTDGSSADSDVLIGADGIHSVVRASLRPEITPRYAGYVAWRGVVEDIDVDAADTAMTTESWGLGARFGMVPIGRRRVYWFATANGPAGVRRAPEERRAELLRRFGPWHAPIRQLIERTPVDHLLENDIEDLAPFRGWSRGRVGLMGDAAHATTPNLGQGACMAIESAVALAAQLTMGQSIAAALENYENERRARTAWVTRQSWRMGQVGQWERPWLCALRRQLMRRAPPSTAENMLRRAVGAR
jgi:2-polyprenyl-6-methoxyphenol hydroxylase-like FAD-dependent oxidoreductase